MKMTLDSETSPRSILRQINWTPYLVGMGIGVLCWIAFGIAKDPLGVTTAFSRLSSLFALPVLGAEGVAQNTYWKPMPLHFDYGVVFLIGLMLGSFVSARISKKFRIELIPSHWSERFGDSVVKRFVGARMAGGCTSGHGISGTLQLALSSWVFVAVVFAVGIVFSVFFYGRKWGQS
jgi:uncharacterized membrane protein YedE/YeeE